ncbi:MAG: hypothetical protein KF751_05820 [Nitrospira sp.]|nr:hypothetical protein [Nitrospira sp.]
MRNFSASSTRSTTSKQASVRHSYRRGGSLADLCHQVILVAIPLIRSAYSIIGHDRSGLNVMSDMLVAILLDAGKTTTPIKAQIDAGM